MNYAIVRFIIGRLLIIEAMLMFPAVIVGLIYQEAFRLIGSFLFTMFVTALTGFMVSRKRPSSEDLYSLEGFVIVALSWFLLSFFGAFPFYLSGAVPSFVDALFESTSGFTTTGASVLGNVETLSHALLFWRSFTLMIGGMGMLVFVLTILPKLGSKGVHIMRAELPGPTFGKVESRVEKSINILYGIYVLMTLLLVVLLYLGDVPLFEAILLALGACGTGGFGIHPNSIAYYNSNYVEIVMAIAMFTFGINFNLFYLLYLRKWKQILKNEELKWYIGIILVSVTLICLQIWSLYDSVLLMLKDVFFTVVSIMSTTAYTTADFKIWPVGSHVVLLALMFSGAMAGSTTSGLKVTRIAIYIKMVWQEMKRAVSPNRSVPLKFEGKLLEEKTLRSLSFYLVTYAAVFMLLLFLIGADTDTFSGAFSAVIATLSNIGHGLDLFGPASDYSEFSDRSKLILSVAMVMGRLEIYPVLVLLSPRTWRKN